MLVLAVAAMLTFVGGSSGFPTQEPVTPPPQVPAPATDEATEPQFGRVRLWLNDHGLHVEKKFEQAQARGFFPVVGTIVPGAGISGGLEYRDFHPFGSSIGVDATAMVSYRDYRMLRLQVGLLDRRDTSESLNPISAHAASLFNDHASKRRGFAAYADLRHVNAPESIFYGIGASTRAADRAAYLLQLTSFDAVVQHQVTPRFGLAARIGLLVPTLGTGRDSNERDLRSVFDARTAPGLNAVQRFLTAGLAAVVDARDTPEDPHGGLYAAAGLWRFEGRQVDGFDFARVVGDLRWYSTPFTSRGVVALRALVSNDVPDDGADVPFYLRQTLGGGETLRGFHHNRFADRAVAAFSAEYRWRATGRLDAGAFVDAGTVARSLSTLRARTLEMSSGVRVGLRYKGRVIGHLDWGISREGHRVTIGTATLF